MRNLNDYFANLCHDYARLAPMDITENTTAHTAPGLLHSARNKANIYRARLYTILGLEEEHCHIGTCNTSNLKPILVNSKVDQYMEAS